MKQLAQRAGWSRRFPWTRTAFHACHSMENSKQAAACEFVIFSGERNVHGGARVQHSKRMLELKQVASLLRMPEQLASYCSSAIELGRSATEPVTSYNTSRQSKVLPETLANNQQRVHA